jgi:hypothetical protein
MAVNTMPCLCFSQEGQLPGGFVIAQNPLHHHRQVQVFQKFLKTRKRIIALDNPRVGGGVKEEGFHITKRTRVSDLRPLTRDGVGCRGTHSELRL